MSINGFAFPTPIKFGAGARKEVAAHLKSKGLKRPLIVTDKALGALPVMAEFLTHPALGARHGFFPWTCCSVLA